jgi:hypothetical protein
MLNYKFILYCFHENNINNNYEFDHNKIKEINIIEYYYFRHFKMLFKYLRLENLMNFYFL